MITRATEQKDEQGNLTGYSVVYDDGTEWGNVNHGSRFYTELMDWVAQGNTIAPYVAPMPPPKTRFSSAQYFDKFTTIEQDAIIAETYNDLQVKKFYDRMWGSDYIDLDDPLTPAGLDLLVSKNLITSARKTELLTPVVF